MKLNILLLTFFVFLLLAFPSVKAAGYSLEEGCGDGMCATALRECSLCGRDCRLVDCCGDGICQIGLADQDESCSSCGQDCCPGGVPVPPSGGGGGGGGEAGGGVAILREFSTNVDSLILELLSKEIKQVYLIINNTGNVKLNIEILSTLEFFSISEIKFELLPGKMKTIEITIIGPEEGIEKGKIFIQTDGLKKEIPVIVQTRGKALLDVIVNVKNKLKKVSPGEEVLAEIATINLGKRERTDMNLTYSIMKNDKAIVTKNEVLAVETTLSIIKSLTLPENAKAGTYKFLVSVTYDHTTIGGYDEFTAEVFPFKILFIAIASFFVLSSLFLTIRFFSMRRRERLLRVIRPYIKEAMLRNIGEKVLEQALIGKGWPLKIIEPEIKKYKGIIEKSKTFR